MRAKVKICSCSQGAENCVSICIVCKAHCSFAYDFVARDVGSGYCSRCHVWNGNKDSVEEEANEEAQEETPKDEAEIKLESLVRTLEVSMNEDQMECGH
ncbi:hypothetical protein MUK42_29737 [Musa troglodytarum]|uniref:Uncharacterized protein n=1 Tax=Musa troglodytarum TaxID=320322 RepID=A0A9E7FNY1_9LILI|nr:hypothetical protein MUK42_29737 [Musa troglodytarum]